MRRFFGKGEEYHRDSVFVSTEDLKNPSRKRETLLVLLTQLEHGQKCYLVLHPGDTVRRPNVYRGSRSERTITEEIDGTTTFEITHTVGMTTSNAVSIYGFDLRDSKEDPQRPKHYTFYFETEEFHLPQSH